MKVHFALPGCVMTALLLPASLLYAADSQSVNLSSNVEIPGGSLKAGSYTLSLEDRLSDRAIVRITNDQDASDHHLLLTVPNQKLPSDAGVAYFTLHPDNTQALRSWKCASCAAPLEFAYPKLEAVKITDASATPVLAVDPTYDKLPENLSADDMKVVTLWLLAPEHVTAGVGEGVKAAKLKDANAGSDVAAAPAPAAASTTSSSDQQQVASATPRHRLPKTASNNYLFGLLGLLSVAGALTLRIARRA